MYPKDTCAKTVDYCGKNEPICKWKTAMNMNKRPRRTSSCKIGFELDDGWDDYYVRLVFFKATHEHTNVLVDYISEQEKESAPAVGQVGRPTTNRTFGPFASRKKDGTFAQAHPGAHLKSFTILGFELKGIHGEHQQTS
jgi:hypothetical protein